MIIELNFLQIYMYIVKILQEENITIAPTALEPNWAITLRNVRENTQRTPEHIEFDMVLGFWITVFWSYGQILQGNKLSHYPYFMVMGLN